VMEDATKTGISGACDGSTSRGTNNFMVLRLVHVIEVRSIIEKQREEER